jgi:L-serine dehydratase|nr:L-serine ammonia-lyase, iron-sulfur-dependent, subunit alpha [Zhaonella formicivorans]
MFYKTVAELVKTAEQRKCPISTIVLENQVENTELTLDELLKQMDKNWSVMVEAMERGLNEEVRSVSGLTGGDAKKLYQAHLSGSSPLSGGPVMETVARALAVAEVNAAMGRIVAAPTAGSCGVVPAVVYTVANLRGNSRSDIVKALFTAAGFGMIIAYNASISGAEGGCQAECGSASCMAAAAAVELAGGTPVQAAHAGAIALKNVLGLVCDPVAGLVEVPCIKRNAMAAANAMVAADLALSGIESRIPIDEVIGAMKEIGKSMPATLKETACGGLANTPTARLLERQLFEAYEE